MPEFVRCPKCRKRTPLPDAGGGGQLLICMACGSRFPSSGSVSAAEGPFPTEQPPEAMNELAALVSRPALPRVRRRPAFRISGAAFGLGAFSASIAILIWTWIAFERRENRPAIPVAQVSSIHQEPAVPATLPGFGDTTRPTSDGWDPV